MKYVELTIEEAMRICKKNTKVLVAIQNLEDGDVDIVFKPKRKEEYPEIFKDVEQVVSHMDDMIKELRCFTERQSLGNIKPRGVQKIVLVNRI